MPGTTDNSTLQRIFLWIMKIIVGQFRSFTEPLHFLSAPILRLTIIIYSPCLSLSRYRSDCIYGLSSINLYLIIQNSRIDLKSAQSELERTKSNQRHTIDDNFGRIIIIYTTMYIAVSFMPQFSVASDSDWAFCLSRLYSAKYSGKALSTSVSSAVLNFCRGEVSFNRDTIAKMLRHVALYVHQA